jgi:transcriptional regulator with XRE-family HTH domain
MNLRQIRQLKGQTQFDLRLKTGIHQTKISHFERGYLEPGEEEKKLISQALGCDLADIDWDARQGKCLGNY